MAKVLILTAGYGEGHNSAARALVEALGEHPGVEPVLLDVFALKAPRMNELSRRAYVRLINAAPRLWAAVYAWVDRSPLVPRLIARLRGHRRLLARLIAEHRPVAICSTYPVYGWMLAEIRREQGLSCPLYTIVTDALTINSLWYRAPAERWFVTDPDSAEFLRARGVPAERVSVSGFPVALALAEPVTTPLPAPGTHPRVLFMINSGRSRALALARALLRQSGWTITFTAGRDETLRRQLIELSPGAPARAEVLGWTNRIPELLRSHHVVVSKAGGATTQESINALCPMIVCQVVPGQEEGNYELLRRHGAGARAETPEALIATLREAWAEDGAQWRRWRQGLMGLARPAAAREIARLVVGQQSGLPPAARVAQPDRTSTV
jgi:processive 1,2-diacylglycerol beta-glucosyltransferase